MMIKSKKKIKLNLIFLFKIAFLSLRKREPFKKDGNIARLNAADDDESDTNTWNGNSTEQM